LVRLSSGLQRPVDSLRKFEIDDVFAMWRGHDKQGNLGGGEGKILREFQASLGDTIRSVALIAKDRRLKPGIADPAPTPRMIMMLMEAGHPILEPVR
jgi:hypothetical protein